MQTRPADVAVAETSVYTCVQTRMCKSPLRTCACRKETNGMVKETYSCGRNKDKRDPRIGQKRPTIVQKRPTHVAVTICFCAHAHEQMRMW